MKKVVSRSNYRLASNEINVFPHPVGIAFLHFICYMDVLVQGK